MLLGLLSRRLSWKEFRLIWGMAKAHRAAEKRKMKA
jgi:hypothetical protein